MSPAQVIALVNASSVRGRGRGGIPDRHEMGARAQGAGRHEIHLLQRRRGGAGHLQGPRDPDRAARCSSSKAWRSRATRWGRGTESCTSATNTATCARTSSTRSTRCGNGVSSVPRWPGRPASPSTSRSSSGRAPTSAARNPRSSNPPRASGGSRATVLLSPSPRGISRSPRS